MLYKEVMNAMQESSFLIPKSSTAAEAFLMSERWTDMKFLSSGDNLSLSEARMAGTSLMDHNGSTNKLLIKSPRWWMVESNCCRAITVEFLLVGFLPAMLFCPPMTLPVMLWLADLQLHLVWYCMMAMDDVLAVEMDRLLGRKEEIRPFRLATRTSEGAC